MTSFCWPVCSRRSTTLSKSSSCCRSACPFSHSMRRRTWSAKFRRGFSLRPVLITLRPRRPLAPLRRRRPLPRPTRPSFPPDPTGAGPSSGSLSAPPHFSSSSSTKVVGSMTSPALSSSSLRICIAWRWPALTKAIPTSSKSNSSRRLALAFNHCTRFSTFWIRTLSSTGSPPPLSLPLAFLPTGASSLPPRILRAAALR
mmetsp:Transcript_44799/g.133881  ORF Transcript_44799/g.133881 Transcript_44799/m.133881 type:complete len:200 (+) Transcript_44799:1396-1995(+)